MTLRLSKVLFNNDCSFSRVVLEFSNDNLRTFILLYIFKKCELSIMFKIYVRLKLTSIFRFFIFHCRVLKFTFRVLFSNTCFKTLNNQSIHTVAIRVRKDPSTSYNPTKRDSLSDKSRKNRGPMSQQVWHHTERCLPARRSSVAPYWKIPSCS